MLFGDEGYSFSILLRCKRVIIFACIDMRFTGRQIVLPIIESVKLLFKLFKTDVLRRDSEAPLILDNSSYAAQVQLE